jgi:AraC-like DNA-binding protein
MPVLSSIPRVGFQPPSGYALDVEVFPAKSWLARVPDEHIRYPSRLDFHQLILVTRGRFQHTVDFHLESAGTGSLLAMRLGQVQKFERNKAWDGWVVIFRSESSPIHALFTEDLSAHRTLDRASCEAMRNTMAQMHQDAQKTGVTPLISSLVQAQLQTLLIRLRLAQEQTRASPLQQSSLARHFKRFRELSEQRFCEWHQISAYAKRLGISEKTLSRATHEAEGLSAKAYLSKRIALEAKRMLTHTDLPIAHVADQLGFDEPTNFIKFFRREAGDTPSEFRKLHRGL